MNVTMSGLLGMGDGACGDGGADWVAGSWSRPEVSAGKADDLYDQIPAFAALAEQKGGLNQKSPRLRRLRVEPSTAEESAR